MSWGRVSVPGARYFITLGTQSRAPVLTSPPTAEHIIAVLRSLPADDSTLLAATLMPDHMHLLITLGARLTVPQFLGKLKTLTRDRGRASWRWLPSGYEHRLRPNESAEDYAFYIFMNPYRAGLCPLAQSWPWWVCTTGSGFRFSDHLGLDGTPPPEWLGEIERLAPNLYTGAG